MKRLSQREELANIEEIAAKLNFKPVRKKALEYKQTGQDQLSPLTYAISKHQDRIETITGDGLETTNAANVGDYIFCGPSGELYVLKESKVKKMYTGSMGGTLTPEQTPRQVARYEGKQIQFTAPWGEAMVLKPDDYLVKEQDSSGYYRIAKKEFEQTYEAFNG